MPLLSKLTIEQYRGFYAAQEFELAVPNGNRGSGLTILVGPNNSGKSSVIGALRFATGKQRQVDLEHRHPDVAMKITLYNDAGSHKTVTNPDRGATTIVIGAPDAYPNLHDVRIVPSRRAWSAYTPQQSMEVDSYWSYSRQQLAEDNHLVSRLGALSADHLATFNQLLKELLPEVNSWKIELSRGQTFVQYTTLSGAQHAADLFGDGMASLFRLALAIFDSGKDNVVVIDEPELSLHPQAQKTLASVLARYSSDRQILITTHSPHFISWKDIANGAKVYRLTQKKDGVVVGSLDVSTIQKLQGLIDDWQKPNLLDAVSREVFFADEVVFLEGQEDVGLLRRFCEDRDLPMISAIGYGAGGFGNIKHFLSMAEDLGIRAAALYDGDHENEKKEAVGEFPDALVRWLPTPDIRDKPVRDQQGKETSVIGKLGIFDRSGVIKTEYEQFLLGLLAEIRQFLKVA